MPLYQSVLADLHCLQPPCRWRVAGALALLLASKSFNVLVGVLSLMALWSVGKLAPATASYSAQEKLRIVCQTSIVTSIVTAML